MMSKFSHHEGCDICGSKDNKAVYEDGSTFCFGCRTFTKGITDIREVFRAQPPDTLQTTKDFPWDAQEGMPIEPLKWLLQYGITNQERKRHGIYWSPQRQMLCWQIKSPRDAILGWQGRNFSPTAKAKYTSYGSLHSDLCILGDQRPVNFADDGDDTVVLVEDYISAIKVSSLIPCIPLFGCTIGLEGLQAIKKRFKGVIIWLDSDKLENARKIALKANMTGLTGQVLFTELDPKCYNTRDIKAFLETLNVDL